MKKVLVIVFITLLVAVPVTAEEMLTLKGAYDVSAVWGDNFTEQYTGVDQGDADNREYVYQRFRLGVKIKPASGIQARLRFDFAENQWGQDQAFSSYRASDDAEIQVDRAHVDINQDLFQIKAGLQFIPLGLSKVYRDNQPGLQIILKTPVSVRLGYVKVSEGIGSNSDSFGTQLSRLTDSGDENEDTDRYFIDLGYKTDAFKVNAFYWMQNDDSTGDADDDGVVDNFKDDPWVAGVTAFTTLAGFNLRSELATFGGDNGNGVDYTGTQLIVAGTKKINDSFTLGLDTWYSSPADEGEAKITRVGNPFADYDIKYGANYGWDMAIYGRTNTQVFCGPASGPLPGDVLDPFLTGAGSIGAGIGAQYKPMEKVTLHGQVNYMIAADDDIAGVTGEFENGYNFLVAAGYAFAPHTSLHATYQNVGAEFADGVDVDDAQLFTLRMHVAF